MAQIPPIEDGYIDGVIKSHAPYDPDLDQTQGVKMRELVKLMRDRLEQEIDAIPKPFIPLYREDLDLVKTNGIYIQSTTAEATTARNYPANNGAGCLEVRTNTDASIGVQSFTIFQGSSSRMTWVRTWSGITFTPWSKQWSERDFTLDQFLLGTSHEKVPSSWAVHNAIERNSAQANYTVYDVDSDHEFQSSNSNRIYILANIESNNAKLTYYKGNIAINFTRNILIQNGPSNFDTALKIKHTEESQISTVVTTEGIDTLALGEEKTYPMLKGEFFQLYRANLTTLILIKIGGARSNQNTDDIEITDPNKGIILRSPDNSRWRISVGNDGIISTTKI